MSPGRVSRRGLLAGAGLVAGSVLAGDLLAGHLGEAGRLAAASEPRLGLAGVPGSGYVPDGLAGLAAAFPRSAVRLLASPFQANQARNTSYLLFVDPARLLHTFRLNYGLPSAAWPCGGWERPESEVRGHTTGHLLSALALTYAGTASQAALDKGRYLVGQLAGFQARAGSAGFHRGYLSAFPESFFDRLEAGQPVWAPYYMIHKYLAGLIDQYELAGNDQAIEVAAGLADWVCWRTGRLSYARMQQILTVEYGGIAEALANLYRLTGQHRYLVAARRFDDAAVLDPLARGQDRLNGLHANTTVPKIIAAVRMWEETGDRRYRDIAENFWRIVTQHHSYIIGGSSNHEHWHEPDVIAGQLSNLTCENCVSYNMLKLTRLLHFHQPGRIDLLDHYERTLFNQMLGEQDTDSPHGFNEYYYGLSPGAFKQQPLNYFPRGNPDVYSTNYENFTCDNATGME
ncbi:MAG TPA: beta-L-arabinofuranosidase domain-containing protein, partial [Streptosporangiaceae bacterium]|nr:beta-L-arabinofuranosidase domain-containing protein [Streptosporangiaceae bacterium]